MTQLQAVYFEQNFAKKHTEFDQKQNYNLSFSLQYRYFVV